MVWLAWLMGRVRYVGLVAMCSVSTAVGGEHSPAAARPAGKSGRSGHPVSWDSERMHALMHVAYLAAAAEHHETE